MVLRLCAALSTTQLLPLIHILRNEPRDEFQDVLVWGSYDDAKQNREAMLQIIKAHNFAAAVELVGFEMMKPRTSGPVVWLFESIRCYRHDARKMRASLEPFLRRAKSIEVWTDEPIHFPMRFLHALFPRAVHVKFPHSFDHDNAASAAYREMFLSRFREEATWRRRLFWAALQLLSGLRFTANTGLTFDRAYTFDVVSPWSVNSVDVSRLIEPEALAATYQQLPIELRDEIARKVTLAAGTEKRRWALVLLFGLRGCARQEYRDSIIRVFSEHAAELGSLQLVLKPHPLNRDDQPRILAEELSGALKRPVTIFDCTLNLDILWSVVPADVVLSGPSGALPVIRRSRTARAVILREILNHVIGAFPHNRSIYEMLSAGYEIW